MKTRTLFILIIALCIITLPCVLYMGSREIDRDFAKPGQPAVTEEKNDQPTVTKTTEVAIELPSREDSSPDLAPETIEALKKAGYWPVKLSPVKMAAELKKPTQKTQ